MAPLLAVLLIAATQVVAGQDGVTYVQPNRTINCPPPDQVCHIQLTVSYMQTLTAYKVKNGKRSDENSGFKVIVNEQGGFDFKYPSKVTTSTLFQPIVADGITRRNLMVVNDQLPGPTIIGYKNQRVRINVTNSLGKEAITLHWHGQHVNGSTGSQNQYSDGVPYITQCPILPGNSFVYDYQFYPAGTYWYHSHQYDERSNGMYGGLVVLDPDQPEKEYEDKPDEHTIAFFEWFPVNSDSWIEAPFSLPDPVNGSKPYESVKTFDGTEAGNSPFFAGFMNFGGWRFNNTLSNWNRSSLDQTCMPPVANTPLPFFNVTQNSSYRFRLIGSQVNYAYRFSIHGHRLRVIATDGMDATIPSNITDEVDFIIVHVGERYDFVLEASNSVNNYLMLIETLENPSILAERCYCIKAHRGYAVLHYDGADDTITTNFSDSYDPLKRCTRTNQCFALNCPFENYPGEFNIQCISVANLVPTNPEPVPNNDVSPSAFFNFGFSSFGPSVNDRVFQFPHSPLIALRNFSSVDNFCNYRTLQETLVPSSPGSSSATPTPNIAPEPPFKCIHTYNAETDTVEMVYLNIALNGAAHPIHLHGHHYFILDIGYPTYADSGVATMPNGAINCSADSRGNCNVGASWSNGAPPPSVCEANNNCPLKDTVIVPVGGYVRIRFPRNNWGWWIMHCHIEPHLLGGMALVVNETSVMGHFPVPDNFPMCSNFDFVPGEPATQSPQPLSPAGMIYMDATIALAVIASPLLVLVVALVIALVVVCVKSSKKGGGVTKVEIEMK